MKSAIRVCWALMLAPAIVVAQASPGAARPTRSTSDPALAKDGPVPVADVETHTVQRGDTLWDLSARYLSSPWYWPKVWSYNPEIGNPHWIYPGNVVRLRPATPGAPAVADDDGPPARDLDALSVADLQKPQGYGDSDDVTVGGPWKIGYHARGTVRARRDSYVTQAQVDASGVINASFEDKLLLSVYDRIYVKFRGDAPVKPGATCVLYQTQHEIRHPVTGEVFGYKQRILGAARVVGVNGDTATMEIAQAYEPIERGALVGNWTDAVVKAIRPRPNARTVDGVIVATHQEIVSAIGEHHVVFVDRGRVDGVEEGNVFTVLRAGDPYGRDMDDLIRESPRSALPSEDIGTLMVIDVHDTSSAALVVRSMRELSVGDRVEMRGPPGSQPAAVSVKPAAVSVTTRSPAEPR